MRIAVALVGPIALFAPAYLAVRADRGDQDARAYAAGMAITVGVVPAIAWDATPWFRAWAIGVYLAMLAVVVLVLVRSRRTALLEERSDE